MIKKTVIAGFIAAAFGSGVAQAQSASPHSITGNVGIYSQYVFRGISQTNGDPAIQGGFDYSHSSGLYAGTWASNISWLRDTDAYSSGGSAELDFYGGFRNTFGKSDFGYDVGVLYYYYPGDAAVGFVKADTWEAYGALSWKWLSLKYSYSLDNKTFGVTDSSGTWYLDFTANFPVTDKLTLTGHYGKQKYEGDTSTPGVSNDSLYSYEDWKIGASYALPKDFTIGVFYTDTTSINEAGYTTPAAHGARFNGKGQATVFISKSF